MSRNTLEWQIEALQANVKHQVADKACAVNFYLIACTDSANTMDTTQLLFFCGELIFLHFGGTG